MTLGQLVPSTEALSPAPNALGVYVHIPFCERKCHYCDFNSGVHGPEVRDRYVQALIREIRSSPLSKAPCRSVFVGGGTPSVLSGTALAKILFAVRDTFAVAPGSEITIECNPGTLASERMAGETIETFLRVIRDAGVNRLSFGVQSFDSGLLKRLGRIHSPRQAIDSVHMAQDTGFGNINVDLMFALPGQTTSQWDDTLETAIALGVEHISAYSLIVEPATPFAQLDADGKLDRCSEDDEVAMYESAIEALTSAGYDHYEVSAFGKPGRRSIHNSIYWRNESYLGFGLGATSYVDGERSTREASMESYVGLAENGEDTVVSRERLGREDTMGETMMMGLRLLDGIDRTGFAARFGEDPAEAFQDVIPPLLANGLLNVTPTHIRLTHRGLLLANEVWQAFI